MARSSREENRYDYLVLPLQQLGACGQGHEGFVSSSSSTCSCIHPHNGEHVESYEALDFRHSAQDCVKLTIVIPLPFQQKIVV